MTFSSWITSNKGFSNIARLKRRTILTAMLEPLSGFRDRNPYGQKLIATLQAVA